MIKKLLTVFLIAISLNVMAQESTAYQRQRNKVNSLLSQRSAKFGQYQKSLNSRTGIFGMQTKKDVKNSNDILRQITLHDNLIFRELKVLMQYKEMQVQEVQNTAEVSNDRIQRYTLAIKKLQERNQELKSRTAKLERNQQISYAVFAALAIAFIVVLVTMTGKIRKLRRQPF